MTTVVYSDGVLASDSRFTSGTTQVDGLVEKIGVIPDGINYGMAGRADFMAMCHDYCIAVQGISLEHLGIIFASTAQPLPNMDRQCTFELLIEHKAQCHKFIYVQAGGFRDDGVSMRKTAGSGGMYADEYMSTQSTDAIEAVEHAITLDDFSGGHIMATHQRNASTPIVSPFIINQQAAGSKMKELEGKVAQLQLPDGQGMPFAAIANYSQDVLDGLPLVTTAVFGKIDQTFASEYVDKVITK